MPGEVFVCFGMRVWFHVLCRQSNQRLHSVCVCEFVVRMCMVIAQIYLLPKMHM